MGSSRDAMGSRSDTHLRYMRTLQTNDCRDPAGCQYALWRGVDYWALVLAGEEAVFKHELGATYVAYLLREQAREPIHGVALALKAREMFAQAAEPGEILEEQTMDLQEAAAVRGLWRRQRELERVLGDRLESEPVKAEALRELEEITEHLRRSPWLSRHEAERCARAMGVAIKRLHGRLAAAVDAEGAPDEVLRAFARHLHEYLLVPSGRGGGPEGDWAVSVAAGCFTYEPPRGVVWEVRGQKTEDRGQKTEDRKLAAVGYLSRFMGVGLALGLMATGCAGSRPLKGGKAILSRTPTGVVEQTLVQSENPAQATKQDQESFKVRSYTVPAGSRMEQSQPTAAVAAQSTTRKSASREPSTLNSQPSTTLILSAPMPVVEREETRARTELGAAQKDMARELGAKLASLKGIVWIGVGLFVFGLGSLVWPPLQAVIGSVTTSAALTLGGLALMVLPSLIAGNELLILGGVAAGVGGWFLAHRDGELRGRSSVTSNQ
jgi:hypothetical protein